METSWSTWSGQTRTAPPTCTDFRISARSWRRATSEPRESANSMRTSVLDRRAPASRAVRAAALVAAIALFTGVMLGQARRGPGYDLVPIATAGRLAAAGAIE